MSLSNELSSEIAAAILSASNKTSQELKALEDVVFRVHSTLKQMDDRARSDRSKLKAETGRTATSSGAS
ncbi:MAG TPA: hypothetical protein VE135_27545 [Pyrinomonadaceae bacterium]|nr:hypothetical protein [Pyrinomonadaceae bacterium]